MKQQQIEKKKPKKSAVIIDSRKPKAPKIPPIDLSVANMPVRTVHYVEIGNMHSKQLQLLLQEMNKMYDTAHGINYFIPVRHGKISCDIQFEAEFLTVVNEMCEIKDGEIILKGGAKDVQVIRQQI